MIEKFIDWSPKPETKALVAHCAAALEELEGYEPTLRSLYYHLVTDNIIANIDSEYAKLKGLMTKARNAGMIRWDAFVDKGRSTELFWSNEDPKSLFRNLEQQIWFDYWDRQETHVEIWVEKQAQEGVVKVVGERFKVPYLACKGYPSSTVLYDAGKRFENIYYDTDKPTVVIHLGDHDPSGIDMGRDLADRLEMYSNGSPVEIQRIALNMDQVLEYDLPSQPAKKTDKRARRYIDRFGDRSWELDALKPKVLEPIITAAVKKYIDTDIWNDVLANEAEIKKPLRWVDENTSEVWEYINKRMNEDGE